MLRILERINGKVVHRTLGNLTCRIELEIEAVRLALKHKERLIEALRRAGVDVPPLKSSGKVSGKLLTNTDLPRITQGPSISAVSVLMQIAKQIGIVKALGEDTQGQKEASFLCKWLTHRFP